jgi:hypothetical protein
MQQVIDMTREQHRDQLLVDVRLEADKIASVLLSLLVRGAELAGDKAKADMVREVGPNTVSVALEMASTEFELDLEASAISQALGYFECAAGLAMAQLAGE